MPTLKFINKSNNPLPEYKTPGSSGMDVRADIDSPITVQPLRRVIVPTGLYPEIPEGYEIQVRPRSGLAVNNGITVLNTPGTVDESYRGEIKVALINLGSESFVINPGDRIAQLVLCKYERAEVIPVDEISETERGDSGFGSTGTS